MEPSMQAILDSTTRPGDALADLRAQLSLRDIYREVAENTGSLADVIASAQRHDNGFSKIVIGRSSQTGLNIHNHRWDFASMVIRGICAQATWP